MKTINLKNVLAGALILIVIAIALMSCGRRSESNATHKVSGESILHKNVKAGWQHVKWWADREDKASDWLDE